MWPHIRGALFKTHLHITLENLPTSNKWALSHYMSCSVQTKTPVSQKFLIHGISKETPCLTASCSVRAQITLTASIFQSKSTELWNKGRWRGKVTSSLSFWKQRSRKTREIINHFSPPCLSNSSWHQSRVQWGKMNSVVFDKQLWFLQECCWLGCSGCRHYPRTRICTLIQEAVQLLEEQICFQCCCLKLCWSAHSIKHSQKLSN